MNTYNKKKIIDLIFSDRLQRCYYFLLLVFWSYMWRNDIICCYDSETTISGIKNYYFIFIPIILFSIQIVFNNFFAWILIFSIVILLSAYKLYSMISWQIMASEREYIKSEAYQKEEAIQYAIVLLVLILLNVFFYKLKPHNGKIKKSHAHNRV